MNSKVKLHYFLALTLAMLAIQPMAAWSRNIPSQSNSGAQVHQLHRGWLGVYLRPVPDALAAQLADLMPAGEGVLVDEVEEGSPAAKAGVQAHDILLALGDQKLYSPAQLSRLVGSGKAGGEVDLQLIHAGKLQTVKVAITPRSPSAMARPAPYPRHSYGRAMPRPPQRAPGAQARPIAPLAWDSFESVEVKTLQDGRYHAEVSFKNDKNETKTFTFEGKKEDIIAQINEQADLPKEKREALLDALNMNERDLMRPFRSLFQHGNPFNDPFFNENPFDDSFFQNPFFYGYPRINRHPWFD